MTNFRTVKKNGKKRAVPISSGTTRKVGRLRGLDKQEAKNQVIKERDAATLEYFKGLHTFQERKDALTAYYNKGKNFNGYYVIGYKDINGEVKWAVTWVNLYVPYARSANSDFITPSFDKALDDCYSARLPSSF